MRRLTVLAVILASLPCFAPAAYSRQQIVGGRPASRPYPFMASIQTIEGDHFCGGSLVRERWVLTAKHCVQGTIPGSIRVMLGSQNLAAPGQIHEVTQIKTHAGSDSAVLRLNTPSTLEPIRIAGLDEKTTWVPGTLATALGWGTELFLSPTSPDQLQEVEIHVVADADCQRSYGLAGGQINPANEVCAGEPTGGRDTCQGDSGGPIMVPDARGRLMVFGTTYRGLGCGVPLFYGIYARVGDTAIRSWLDANLPPESSLSIESASIVEGAPGSNTALAITVRRAGTTTKTARVDFTTADGTATAGSDYRPLSGTLFFEPDDKTRTIFVPILGDDLAELDETFEIRLSNPVEAEIQVANAVGAVLDDD